jgi:fumarate reductase subunit D
MPKEWRLKWLIAATRVGIIALLTLASIAFHEFGHFIVYRLGGYPVRITLQSVRPVGDVSPPLNLLALAAGPAFNLIAAVVCLLLARRRPTFFWITAAFINAATLRLFPLIMDIIRAIEKTTPFSDEGHLVIAITTNPICRVILLLIIFAVFFSLAAVIARLYNFRNHRAAKLAGIYCLSLGVALGVVLTDELLK